MRSELRGRAPAPEVVAVGETMGCFLLDERPHACDVTFIGAESNVAIGLASLGHRAMWASRLGDDRTGDHIVTSLTERNVQVHGTRDDEHPTGVSIKELGQDGTAVRYYRRGSAAAHLTWADLPSLRGVRWLHLTGITPALSPACQELTSQLVSTAAAEGVGVSFDVNLRSVLWDDLGEARATLLPLMCAADLVFVGDDEAALLGLGATLGQVRDLVDYDDERIVVFKRGAAGASVSARGHDYAVPAVPAEVVDLTGAGDAFAAGFLSGLLRDLPVDRCLRLGTLMASRVIGMRHDFLDAAEALEMRRLADDLASDPDPLLRGAR